MVPVSLHLASLIQEDRRANQLPYIQCDGEAAQYSLFVFFLFVSLFPLPDGHIRIDPFLLVQAASVQRYRQ